LKWLDDANSDMTALAAKGETISGDFYFNGDLKKWQKVVNAYRLRVLITLSKKDADAELGVKTKFAEMIGNPSKYPLLGSNAESLQFVWNNFNKYPSNPDNFGFDATRQNMASTYVGFLVKTQDPRVMATCEPAGADLKAGKLASEQGQVITSMTWQEMQVCQMVQDLPQVSTHSKIVRVTTKLIRVKIRSS
jgi:hypothetical protein